MAAEAGTATEPGGASSHASRSRGTGIRGSSTIEVPQMSAVRIGERFRWPANSTLLIGLGLVPWPVPGQNKAGSPALFSDAKRTDVVVVVEPRLTDAP